MVSLNHPDHPESIYALMVSSDSNNYSFKKYVLQPEFYCEDNITQGKMPGNYRGKFVIPYMSIREIDDILERFNNETLDNKDYQFYSKWILDILDKEMERHVVQTQETFEWERPPKEEGKDQVFRTTTWRNGI